MQFLKLPGYPGHSTGQMVDAIAIKIEKWLFWIVLHELPLNSDRL
jgi:hypothetical protein